MSSDRPTSITSSQIRKHTLQQDDINPASLVWQEPVIDKDLSSPPSSGNAEGDRYLIISGGEPSWDLLNEDCSDISDWSDQDFDTGVSEVSPAGQFRFDTNTGAAENAFAGRRKSITIPNTFTYEIKLYHDALGTLADSDYFKIDCRQADEIFDARFASDGLFIRDTDNGYTEVGANLVKEGEWQIWRFLVTFGVLGDGVCDVYLKDSTHDWEKVGTAIPCSFESIAGEYLYLTQFGQTTNDMVTHVDYIKIATGLHTRTWIGLNNTIAQYINDDWSYYAPQEGWFVWVKDEDTLYRFDGSSWDEFSAGGGAGDMEKSTYDINENGIVDKAENVDDGVGNASTAADVKDAVTKKHTQGSDTALGAQAEDLDMNTHKIVGVTDPISDQDAETKKHVADTYATIAIANKSTIGITIDGGGIELTTGYKGFIRIPYACTITKVTLLGDISGSIVIDIWKDSYANYPPTDGDSITASAPPTISGATKSEDNTLTAWTTGIDAGDIIAFFVDSITDITKVTLILEVTKT